MGKTLFINATILTMEEGKGPIPWGYVEVNENQITAVGAGEPPQIDPDARVIDCLYQVLMPGFVNTHGHAAMTLFRGIGNDLPLHQWLEAKMFPLEAKLTGEDVYWGTQLAVLEMLKSGTTTFADLYFFMDDVARVVEETGIRANLCRGLVGVASDGEQKLAEAKQFYHDWHGKGNRRITVTLGPHAPYTCPPAYLKKVVEAAGELNTGIQIHIAETRKEFNDIMKEYGKTPVEYCRDAGVFDHHTIAAHCVHLTDKDIETLAAYKVGVAHNPRSNMKLGSGIAPIAELQKAGVAVGIGTDGAASNNNLDMLQEMQMASLLHKVRKENPTALPARTALYMATAGGAEVLGLSGQVGKIAPGYFADLICINFKKPHLTPNHDVEAHLVYAAHSADVTTVMVDGKILVEKGQALYMDEEKIMYEASRAIQELMRR